MTASMMSPSGVMFLKRWMSLAYMLSIMATGQKTEKQERAMSGE
jgi:hypothetical protein